MFLVMYSPFRFFILIAIWLISLSRTVGQETSEPYIIKALPRWMVGIQGYYLSPQHTIRRFLDEGKWGYQVEAQYRVQYNKPFVAGLFFSEAGLSRYVLKYTDSSGGEEVKIREKANTRRVEAGLTAGFYPEINWLIQPYVQGRFGWALFHSSSILTDRDSHEFIERYKELSKIVSAYGLDFGIHIVPNIWYVRGDLRVGITANPSVEFLTLNEELKGTVQFPIDAFEEHTSSAKWLKISLGVTYLF